MLFQAAPIYALGALTFLAQASSSIAGHVGTHRHASSHQYRSRDLEATNPSPHLEERSAPLGYVNVATNELQMLQSEITVFQEWMNALIQSASVLDTATLVAQLKQEVQAFEGWMTVWLDSKLLQGAAPAPQVLPAPVPLPTKASTSPVLATHAVTAAVVVSSKPNPSSASTKVTSTITSKSTSRPASTTIKTTVKATSSSAPVSSTVPGTFNAQSSKNVAVYFGQSGATGQVPLSQICQDPNVDIVILAFLTTYFGPGGYPSVNFGAACGGNTPQMSAKGASGLLYCPIMASDITTCQGKGKKVLLSLGGSIATTTFSSDAQATGFATMLWNLFGAGTGQDPGLRPFGSVKVDGFDIDNEDHSTAYYSTFVSALRSTMNTDTSKKYYISAAPQCPRPDASIPLDAMQTMDFVWVQFYNNGQCDVGQAGFLDSLKAWSSDLRAKGTGPRLYIGAPACQYCAGQGYIDPATMTSTIKSAIGAALPDFGGVMLWDGPEAVLNQASGKDYLQVVKGALG